MTGPVGITSRGAVVFDNVAALRAEGHAVGFLGDGVNDVAALRIADAGVAAAKFETCWFVEGLLTQLLVVLVLRTRGVSWRPALPAGVVVLAAAAAAAIGLLAPVTPLAAGLRMTPPPITYLVWVFGVLAAYGLAAELVKKRYLRHHQA